MAGKPPAKKKRPPAKKGGGKKRKKMRLTLKSRAIKSSGDNYTDGVGWTTSSASEIEESTGPAQPKELKHQCSGCGSILTIPKPKSDKYKVICPHCETVDEPMM